MALLELLTVPTTKSAVESLLSNTPKQFASPTFGEVIPLEAAILTEIPQPTGVRVFNPQSWSGYTSVKAAIGNGFISPVAGTWFILSAIALTSGTIVSGKRYQIITFIAGDDFTNVGAASNASGVIFTATGTTPTTWTHSSVLNEVTSNLAYNAIASDVQSALNATHWITAAGGVVVTIPPGTTLFFLVTFNNDGAQVQMTGYAAQLVPLSIVETGTEVDGDTQTQEIQTIRVGQNAASFVILADDSTGPAITIDELTTGGGGLNAKYSVSLDPLPYDGSFTLLVRGWESQLIPWNAPAIDTNGLTGVQTFIENISANHGTLVTGAKYKIVSFAASDNFSNLGATNVTGNVFVASGTTPTTWTHGSVLSPVAAGNVQVGTTQTGEYLIAFQGDMANTDMGTLSGDPDALKVIPYKLGSLSLDTPGMELLLGSATKIDCFLDITAIPPGESVPQELLRIPITVNAAIIDPSSETPQPINSYYTAVESDQRFASILDQFQFTYAAGGGTPAAGTFTANNDAPGSATQIKISTAAINGAVLQNFLGLIPPGGQFMLSNGISTETFRVLATPTLATGRVTFSITTLNPSGNNFSGTYTLLDANSMLWLPSYLLLGTATNDDATAGYMGEEIQSLVATGSAVSLSTGTAANVTSISLTAGDWDVEGNVNLVLGSATVTAESAGISATSATLPADGSEVYSAVQLVATSENDSLTLPRKRVSVSTTTTIYLVTKATFGAGTIGAFGGITARRVR